MLIKEIEPIDKPGINFLTKQEMQANDIINTIIELPLRKACEIFRKKGIETFMSSANKNNILRKGEKRKEKADVHGSGQEFFYPPPDFRDAGKGYAWIMLNFDTLSDENKDYIFSLEERKGKNGNNIGEKAIWFVHPHPITNIEYRLKIGDLDYDFLKSVVSEGEIIPEKQMIDERLVEFEKRSIVLAYNSGMYKSDQVVILRMPINEETTVEQVDEYFSQLANSFKSQVQIQKKENNDIETDDERI